MWYAGDEEDDSGPEKMVPMRNSTLLGGKRIRVECPVHFYDMKSYYFLGGVKPSPVRVQRITRGSIWQKFGQPLHQLGMTFRDPETETEFQLDWARRSKGYLITMLRIRISLGVLYFLWELYARWNFDFHFVLEQLRAGNETWRIWVHGVTLLLYMTQAMSMRLCLQSVIQNFTAHQVLWAFLQNTIVSIALIYENYKYAEVCAMRWEDILARPPEELKEYVGLLKERHPALMFIHLTTFSMLLIHRLPWIYNMWLFTIMGLIDVTLNPVPTFTYRSFWSSNDFVCQMNRGELASAACFVLAQLVLSRLLETLWRMDYANASAVFEESRRSDQLLANVLPKSIVEELKSITGSRRTVIRHFQLVSVIFADIVSFTTMSARLDAETLVELLNRLFLHFDNICESNRLEKIKTIGDCYMAAGGVPVENNHHFTDVALMGLQMCELLKTGIFRDPITNEPLRVRVGVHAGPVTAGVIGQTKFLYDLWGDAVNTASRMESHGQPMRVHCSEAMAQLLKDSFVLEDRGEMYIKGKGNMKTHFIVQQMPQKKGMLKWKNAL